MRSVATGDIVKVHGNAGLFIAGREHRSGKRRVWSYTLRRASYVSTGRISPTGYNIHTNNPYDIGDSRNEYLEQ